MAKKKFRKKGEWRYKGNYGRKRLQAALRNLNLPEMNLTKSAEIAFAVGRELKFDLTGISQKVAVSYVLSRLEAEHPGLLDSMLPKAEKRKADGPNKDAKVLFYKSWEWRTLRMQVLKENGATCQCCGATRHDQSMSGEPVRICVDHIKPIATHWDLRLDKSNLQVLCDECNQGKGAWDETDWRISEQIKTQMQFVI